MKAQLLLLIAAILPVCSSDSSTVWIPSTQCTFYFQDNHHSSSFTICLSPSFFSYSWNECFTRCCNSPSPSSFPSKQFLQHCTVSQNNNSDLSSTEIAIVCIASLVFLIIVLCCLWRFCKKQASPNDETTSNKIHEIQRKNQTEINNTNVNHIQWSSQSSKTIKLQTLGRPCVICLEEHTTVELPCKHNYHPHCIGSWLAKNNVCPCCRLQQINNLKIYCVSCKWRYFVCQSPLVIQHAKQLPNKCFFCQKEKNIITETFKQKSQEIMFIDSKAKEDFQE